MAIPTLASHAALDAFHPVTQAWFKQAFPAPTRAQQLAWPPIAGGLSTLLLAPTGSGKTLAAFLASLDKIMFRLPAAPADATSSGPSKSKVRVLYISPLKALGVDVDRNLRTPIAGLRTVAEREGTAYHLPSVAVRSGDTTPQERARIQRQAPKYSSPRPSRST